MFSYNKGKGGLINSKWLMILDYERIEKDYGSVPIRIVDHVTYMYYLAFFINKDNPRKQGKALSKHVSFRFLMHHILLPPTEFNLVVERLRDAGIIGHLFFQKPFVTFI